MRQKQLSFVFVRLFSWAISGFTGPTRKGSRAIHAGIHRQFHHFRSCLGRKFFSLDAMWGYCPVRITPDRIAQDAGLPPSRHPSSRCFRGF